MSNWNNLSMQQRAEIMKLAVSNGIYDLGTIRDAYNEYVKGGSLPPTEEWTMEDENGYQIWRSNLPDNLKYTDDSQYNMREAYKAGLQPILNKDGYYHLGSRNPKTGKILKSATHPTLPLALLNDAQQGYYPTVDSRGNIYTQTWKGNELKEGGSIHIKPSHRGRLTELKERTGKSEAELYNDGNPAHKKMVVFARNARKWKHDDGGNLFDDGGGMFVKYVDSYRVNPETGGVYDKTGEVKEGAVILPEVEVIGKPLGKEAIRREADRMRAIQGKQGLSGVDPLGQFVVETAALSPVFKGLEVAGLYGLGRYGEAITGFAKPQNWARGKLISDAMERSLTKPVTATVSPEIPNYWSPSLSTPEEASSINLGDVLNPTTIATERGRTKYLDWINSPSYRQRLQEEPLYKYTDYILDRINKLTNNLKFKYDKNLEQLSEGHSGIVAGETTTKPAKVLRDDGNYRIFDLNTGLDINIANDLGEDAEDTAVHELLHYITANSKGIPEDTGLQTVVDKGWANPLEILYGTSGKNIQRGDKWQSYILDQNNSLLPEYDQVVNMVMKNPQKAKEYLIKAGRTEPEATDAVNRLRDRYSYWSDIQEQRAHLQELFISKIRPNIKNPNDAAEIENYLLEHPEILENSALYKYIQEVRPGSVNQYAKYFASALSTVPFIYNNAKND